MARLIRTTRNGRPLFAPRPRRYGLVSRRPIPSHLWKTAAKGIGAKTKSPASKKRDLEDVMCSVCMECPHNAVLLLCSSHEMGCRPYMCGTSFRHSNCLDQFKNAYMKSAEPDDSTNESSELANLHCPLCRGQVKGWTVVEPARKFFNAKRRNCMQDGCSFVGTYRELRKHVHMDHPLVKPREVDPVLEQKWRSLEREREHQDVISTIMASMPRSFVLGDYVVDLDSSSSESDTEAAGIERSRGQGAANRMLFHLVREVQRFHADNIGLSDSGGEENADAEAFFLPVETSDIEVTATYRLDGIVNTEMSGGLPLPGGHRRRRRVHRRGTST